MELLDDLDEHVGDDRKSVTEATQSALQSAKHWICLMRSISGTDELTRRRPIECFNQQSMGPEFSVG